jgi:hypothetical protein
MTNETHNQPAFPATFAQDSLGRIVVPVPGWTKLEYAALHLLPFYLEKNTKVDLSVNGEKVTAYTASIFAAEQFLEALQKFTEKDIQTITSV